MGPFGIAARRQRGPYDYEDEGDACGMREPTPLSFAVGEVGSFFPRAHCITVGRARMDGQTLWTSEFQSPDGCGTCCTASHGRGMCFLWTEVSVQINYEQAVHNILVIFRVGLEVDTAVADRTQDCTEVSGRGVRWPPPVLLIETKDGLQQSSMTSSSTHRTTSGCGCSHC